MIWFRNEQRYYRIWGGDPKNAHLVDEKGRFSPRKSFAKFAQETRGQSVAWTREELASAAELGSLIEIAALKQSEAFVKSVLNSRPQQTAVLDASGAIVLVNRAWGQKGAGADPVGLDYRSVCAAAVGTPSDADAALAAGGIGSVLKKMAAHYTQEYPCELNGAKRWIRMTVYPVMAPGEGAVVVHSDITLRRKQEDELTQYRQHLEALVDERTAALKVAHAAVEAEQHAAVELLAVENEAKIRSSKLQAVGTLAAGIAHDFNNILASIIGYAEMTADDLPENSTVKRNVAQILSGSLRARDLVARMLAFARAGPAERTAVELASSVEEALALLHSSLPSSIELTFENRLIDRHMSVLGDPTQLVQVVMNLCINSSQAILGRGTISVGLAPAGGYDDAPPSLKGGVCLTVTDSGVGMTPEVQERVFDPFFTTKAPGAGTGLGLSVVYGIVSAMGGDIKVHSSTEKLAAGTQFRVFLPRFVAHPAAAALYCAPTAQP
jgi:signal transduction histidine kinase